MPSEDATLTFVIRPEAYRNKRRHEPSIAVPKNAPIVS